MPFSLEVGDGHVGARRRTEGFGQYSWAHVVTLGDGTGQGRELDSVFLGPFPL